MLINHGWIGVFIGYMEEITKNYKIYYLKLGYIIMLNIVNFDKNIKGGIINLKIRGSNP